MLEVPWKKTLCGEVCLWAWRAISNTWCRNTHQSLSAPCAGQDVHTSVCTNLYLHLCVHCRCIWRPIFFWIKAISVFVHMYMEWFTVVDTKGFHRTLQSLVTRIYPVSLAVTSKCPFQFNTEGFSVCASVCVFVYVAIDIWSSNSSDALEPRVALGLECHTINSSPLQDRIDPDQTKTKFLG